MHRAANPSKGEIVYQQKCVTCHGPGGQGQFKPDQSGYNFPPLWGDHNV
ncbi:c-type cytochrome [Nibrella saemangeumensis]